MQARCLRTRAAAVDHDLQNLVLATGDGVAGERLHLQTVE